MQAKRRRYPPGNFLWTHLWSWAVVGTIAAFLGGTWIAFLTSSHPYIADVFCISAAALVTAKFWTWDIARQETRARPVPVIVSVILTALAVAWDHQAGLWTPALGPGALYITDINGYVVIKLDRQTNRPISRKIRYEIVLKNTTQRSIEYQIGKLAVSGVAEDRFMTRGGIIPPGETAGFFSSYYEVGLGVGGPYSQIIRVLQLKAKYGTPHQYSRAIDKKVRISCSPQAKQCEFVYISDHDERLR